MVVLISLSGCAQLPKLEPSTDANQLWRAKGKFSYKSDAVKESGQFDWQQSGDDYLIRLYGPLGLGTVRIQGSETSVQISAQGETHSNDNPQQLLAQMTGLDLPLENLAAWVRADLGAEVDITELDPDQRTLSAETQGWHLLYKYPPQMQTAENSPPSTLPSSLVAKSGNTRLKLIFKRWE